jgi:hypothetical protein
MKIETTAARLVMAALLLGAGWTPAGAQAPDPRIGLRAGWMNAGEAARNMALVSHTPRPTGFIDPQDMNNFGLINADLAFHGNTTFMGGFHGVQIYDMTDVRRPRLRGTIVCPGGQGDVSVHRNLLFMSVEETRGPAGLRHHGRGGRGERRALPRRAHLRHQQHRGAAPGGHRADVPRLAHAHAGA